MPLLPPPLCAAFQVIKRLDEEMEAALGKLRGEHETETKATAARHKAEVEQLRADLSVAQRKADAASQGIADVNAERDTELHRLNAKVQALNGKLASTDAACAALRADLAEARASARREKEEVEAQGQRFRDASARQVGTGWRWWWWLCRWWWCREGMGSGDGVHGGVVVVLGAVVRR